MAQQPKLIIHGGAGSLEGNIERESGIRDSLKSICKNTYRFLLTSSANDAVIFGIKLLENDPLFNAGTGSKIQSDGQIRMSAGFMSGHNKKFSGVINIQYVQHPILVAEKLQDYDHSVLSGEMSTQFARDLGFIEYNPLTPERLGEYQSQITGTTGTVGVVALDSNGYISAGTSTGGVGGEIPGRVSDSPTVAGNYANRYCGVSATGIGEHIVNSAVAAKIVTRVEDGMALENAVDKSIKEGQENDDHFGVICISTTGDLVSNKTKDTVFYSFHDGDIIKTF
jgi:L-asparaginase